jgi:hypothetical protein
VVAISWVNAGQSAVAEIPIEGASVTEREPATVARSTASLAEMLEKDDCARRPWRFVTRASELDIS